jgi:hypothetical protein
MIRLSNFPPVGQLPAAPTLPAPLFVMKYIINSKAGSSRFVAEQGPELIEKRDCRITITTPTWPHRIFWLNGRALSVAGTRFGNVP